MGWGDVQADAKREIYPASRATKSLPAASRSPLDLEIGAAGNLADFGVFDDAAAEFIECGLQHGAA